MNELEGLFLHNRAPLATIRDIAMLGLIHRCACGRGPRHFAEFFQLSSASGQEQSSAQGKHSRQLGTWRQSMACDWWGRSHRPGPPDYFLRSVFGLVDVFNDLPADVGNLDDTSEFQGALQDMCKGVAAAGHQGWAGILSPRHRA